MNTTQKNILELTIKHGSLRSKEVVEVFKITRQQAAVYLRKLVNEGKLVKVGSTKSAFYMPADGHLPVSQKLSLQLKNSDLKEHEILQKVRDSFHPLKHSRDNVRSIFDYAFSEMLNNAIEHSRSERITIDVSADAKDVMFTIRDWGIGVFRNVMEERGLKNELEAIQDLLKGKTTTAPRAHSGEGIFFTSKTADLFVLESFGWRLRIDNTLPDVFIEPLQESVKGTKVIFSVPISTNRHISDVFNAFTSKNGDKTFSRTEIRVRLFTTGTVYVSRSQARRILTGLDKFKTIVLDFQGVPTVGQAFADEIFRVFRAKHPSIRIEAVRENEAVRFMIDHAG